MKTNRIYLDNHSTTRVDPRVVEAMLPYMTDHYGNPGSTHLFGEEARAAVDAARETIGAAIGATESEVVFTSGATESNNLALRGIAGRYSNKGKHIVTVTTEHPAVLDPLERLKKSGFDIELVPVAWQETDRPGMIDAERISKTLRDDTILVSVMLANNEIGIVQPIRDIARICRDRGVFLHCDAAQAVGKIPVDVKQLDVDLLSFSAHKIYGPRGVGALYIRRRPRVRIEPQIDGGGQQLGRRSGTLNTPGIVGFGKAINICDDELFSETTRIRQLRDHLWHRLRDEISGTKLNGPPIECDEMIRLPGNLNVQFEGVDAESLMIRLPEIAVSTGSACTAEKPEPSHVLLNLGLSEDEARSSIRFGIGRFNTLDEINIVVERIQEAVAELRKLGSTNA